jgi:hypothetical protein
MGSWGMNVGEIGFSCGTMGESCHSSNESLSDRLFGVSEPYTSAVSNSCPDVSDSVSNERIGGRRVELGSGGGGCNGRETS